MHTNYEKYMLTHIKQFTDKHYDYAYLKGMLGCARSYIGKGATLITGSSHALCGIDNNILTNSFNCSMHSQDIYYDFKCGKEVLDLNGQRFSKCFIVMGYYIPCQDLSKSSKVGKEMITKVYYPIFGDSHHLEEFEKIDIYEGFGLQEGFAREVEKKAIERILNEGSYYNFYKKRKPYLKFEDEKKWYELGEDVKAEVGKKRANAHSRIKYRGSYDDNKVIFKDFIHYLTMKDIKPVVVVTPYSRYYNSYIDKEQKEMFMELLSTVDERIEFVDFNDAEGFEDRDFIDADHLNENGAKKVSYILAEMFK